MRRVKKRPAAGTGSRAASVSKSPPKSLSKPEAVRDRPWVRGRYFLAGFALCLLTLLAYSNSFTAGFALDNQILLLGDARLRKATLENLHLIWRHTYWWPTGEAGLYRPLTTLSYLFNYAILGDGNQPAGYHYVNWLLHAATALLVFALALRLLAGRERAFGLAFIIAALWSVHPVLTESVTNIVGRADLLAAAGVLSGFLMYLKSIEANGWRRIVWLAGLAMAAAVGALSKESAVVLPGVVVLHEVLYELSGRGSLAARWKKILWGCIVASLPIALVLWQRARVLSASPAAEFPFVDNPIAGANFWIGRLTAIKVLARYLWVALWPVKLSSDYSYSEIPLVSGTFNDWVAVFLVGALLALAALLYKRERVAFFFLGFAFLNLLPAANLLFPIGTIMAERLLYLPLVGLVAAAVIAIDAASGRFRMPRGAAIALVCLIASAFVIRTWLRNLDWKDDLAMATASVETSPGSFKVHRLLAAALFANDPSHAQIDHVVAEADKSVAILARLPDDLDLPGPWNLAAAVHLAKGDTLSDDGQRRNYQDAVTAAKRSIVIEAAVRAAYDRRHGSKMAVPAVAADAYRLVASAYLRLHQPEQALPPAMEARAIDPSSVEVYAEIADAYLAQGNGEDSAIALAEGMFKTRDGSLREDLLKLYQSGVDTKGCAVVSGPRGPALNPNCDVVRRDLCAGTKRAGRRDVWEQLGCRE